MVCIEGLQVACALTPVATNSLLPNGQIKIDTHSTFKSSSITFSLNKPFRVTLSRILIFFLYETLVQYLGDDI